MQLHRKRRSPTSSASHHPYDLYIISAPFSRVNNNAANYPGRTLIRSVRSDFPSTMNPPNPPPPFIMNDPHSNELKPEKEIDDEEDNYYTYKANNKQDEMEEMETDSDTNTVVDFLNNPTIVPEIIKLVSVCDQVIKYYEDLANKQDLSPYIDTLVNILPGVNHTLANDQQSTTMTPSENITIVDK